MLRTPRRPRSEEGGVAQRAARTCAGFCAAMVNLTPRALRDLAGVDVAVGLRMFLLAVVAASLTSSSPSVSSDLEPPLGRVAITFGASALALSPTVEIEWLIIDKLSVYAAGELHFLTGFGAQFGARLHTGALTGFFLDGHVRFSQDKFHVVFSRDPSRSFAAGAGSEVANPGVAAGWTFRFAERGLFSLGAGMNFNVQSEASPCFLLSCLRTPPAPPVTSAAAPEVRAQIGFVF